jgi:hypothetical protein
MRAIWWCLLLMLWSSVASATLETLVMPGKLATAHAKYEEQCAKCHTPLRNTPQKALCLDCHKEVATDIKTNRGLHGLDPQLIKTDCKTCHTDHKGRGADIVQFNQAQFNHAHTDFPLKGAHQSTLCSACHRTGEPYRKALSSCLDCHKQDDRHAGKLGPQCDKCHSQDQWRDSRFDHNKTSYPLTGKHRQVDCALCHPSQKYKDVPQQCVACHGLNDVHQNRYGDNCKRCHSTQGWKGTAFDHDRDTKYNLVGRHATTPCQGCHNADFKSKLTTDCYSCHRADDEHQGRYGKQCQSCHSPERWAKKQFDHDKATKFPLRGKHREVVCGACHKGPASNEKNKATCQQCHANADIHRRSQGDKCERCHSESGWRERVVFDHDTTQFPLIGLHTAATCADCHPTTEYKGIKSSCLACHGAQDKHKGRLGEKCEACHNPNDWRFWQFDHGQQTKFSLREAHAKLRCDDCHRLATNNLKISSACGDCHRADDVHDGEFGQRCERCHSERSFKDITIKR